MIVQRSISSDFSLAPVGSIGLPPSAPVLIPGRSGLMGLGAACSPLAGLGCSGSAGCSCAGSGGMGCVFLFAAVALGGLYFLNRGTK